MSSNSSNNPAVQPSMSPMRKFGYAIGLAAWVFAGCMLAQLLAIGVVEFLKLLHIPLGAINTTVFNTLAAAMVYGMAIVIVLGVPWLISKKRTTLKDLGLQRLLSWMDILWAPAGAVVYLILTTLVSAAASVVLPFIDYAQKQYTGFSQLASQPEYLLAFVSLVIIAPFAEEILFRGYLFGKLRKHMSLWAAILVTSLLFGLVHFQWNVSVDVFALSIVLCLLRVVSGSLWPSILLHMLKNGIAFYFLFINPTVHSTLGG